MAVISLLGKADRQLGRLDMHSDYVPNINWFIQMHVTKEATQSSRIEGTQTNMEEALLNESDVSREKRDDWREVQNYTKAMNESINLLVKLPISTRLICNAHKTLMQGARGEHKMPGEFRKSQNWIGGTSLTNATFIPPHHSEVPGLMSDLEKFVHNDEFDFPHLLKIALIL
jgi:Fic family protein